MVYRMSDKTATMLDPFRTWFQRDDVDRMLRTAVTAWLAPIDHPDAWRT